MHITFTFKNGSRILLRADDHNYELCRRRSRKDKTSGKDVEEWEAFNWFASLDQALMRVADMKIRTSEATSLEALSADLTAIREEIMRAWSISAQTLRGSGG